MTTVGKPAAAVLRRLFVVLSRLAAAGCATRLRTLGTVGGVGILTDDDRLRFDTAAAAARVRHHVLPVDFVHVTQTRVVLDEHAALVYLYEIRIKK